MMGKVIFRLLAALATATTERIPVGGQAVIQGVLMRGPARWGLCVRRPDQTMWSEHWESGTRTRRFPWKLPIVRGFIMMIEMLGTGMRALNRSAQLALDDEETITPIETAVSIGIAVLAVVGLFIALPLWFADWCARTWSLSSAGKDVIEGLVRGVVFVAYIAGIGMWRDIQQVFRYHGAEHKTINAFENGSEMTSESVLGYSRIHPRCGTSFLLIAIVVSIIVFSAAGHGGLLWRIGSRIVLLPVVIGVSYEIIKGASRCGRIGALLISPALLLQYLTTREPSREQVEVAIRSLEVALDTSFSRTPDERMNNQSEVPDEHRTEA